MVVVRSESITGGGGYDQWLSGLRLISLSLSSSSGCRKILWWRGRWWEWSWWVRDESEKVDMVVVVL